MRQASNLRLSLGPSLTPVVKVIVWINVLVFISIAWLGDALHPALNVPYGSIILSILGLHPQAVIHQYTYWQLVSFLFVHATFLHLLFNMLGLW